MDLTQIIKIRQRKFDDCQREEREALGKHGLARRTLDLAHQRVLDYSKEISTLELDLLTELLNTEITVQDIDALNQKLKDAEDKARRLAGACELAQEQLTEAEAGVRAARLTKQKANSGLNKITAIDEELATERKQLALAAEEAEIDDFVETMFGRAGVI